MTTTMNDAAILHQNAEMRARFEVQESKREQEIARLRAEWNSTPEDEKICTACSLKLDLVTVARIGENPFMPHQHEFCSSLRYQSGVGKGLSSLMKEIYGGDEIPLSEFKKVVETWVSQKGFCAISAIKLQFPVEEEPPTPMKRPSSVNPLDFARMERERRKEWEQSQRAGEVHSPILEFDADGNLRLISKTVAKMMEGLTPDEFRAIVQTLNDKLKVPYSVPSIATTATSYVPRRNRY